MSEGGLYCLESKVVFRLPLTGSFVSCLSSVKVVIADSYTSRVSLTEKVA